MPITRKIIVSLSIAIVVLVATFSAVYFIRDRQLFSQKASTPTGQATISLTPATTSVNLGQSASITINVDPANLPVSGIAVRLKYDYTGATPEVTASNIQIASAISASDDWNCPVKSVTPASATVTIDIACINTHTSGFTSAASFPLATFSLTANQIPPGGSITITFDPLKTIVTRKSDGEDILLTPTSTGTYTVVSPGPTATPTPAPAAPPGEPNACNGTCGSNANCQSSLTCYLGSCRNPDCPSAADCNCRSSPYITPTLTPTPGQLPQTGTAETTLAIILGSLLFLITGTVLFTR